jgi:Las1-like
VCCVVRACSYDMVQRRKKNQKVKVVPWIDRWEHDLVGRSLLSVLGSSDDELSTPPDTGIVEQANNPTRKEYTFRRQILSIPEAVSRVNIWRCRSDVLPHAIEMTGTLADLWWRDHNSQCDASSLRMSYSCAVVRCINGFADVLQQHRGVAASVAMLCQQIGIPLWLVDLRHEATHNALPTLPVLRMAATSLLQYLQQVYWKPIQLDLQQQMNRCEKLWFSYFQRSNQSETAAPADKATASGTSRAEGPAQKVQKRSTIPGEVADCFGGWGDESNGSDGGSESDSDEGGSFGASMVPFARLGTSINRFAPLSNEPQKKKNANKDQQQLATAETISMSASSQLRPRTRQERSKRKRTLPDGVLTGTPSSRANQILKLVEERNIPQDILFGTLLEFLLSNDGTAQTSLSIDATPTKEQTLSTESVADLAQTLQRPNPAQPHGALIPPLELLPQAAPELLSPEIASTQATETQQSMLLQLQPLLTAVVREYPGFATALLSELVDYVCITDQNQYHSSITVTKHCLKFLKFWIQFLLSNDFIQLALNPKLPCVYSPKGGFLSSKRSNDMQDRAIDSPDVAPSPQLKLMGYPLHALWMKCTKVNSQAKQASLPTSWASLASDQPSFFALNGREEIASFLSTVLTHQDRSDRDRHDGSATSTPGSRTINGTSVSLDEMETLLLQEACSERPHSGVLDTVINDNSATELNSATCNGNDPIHSSPDLQPQNVAPDANDSSKKSQQVSLLEDNTNDSAGLLEQSLSSWAICDRWEPCSIGALPGGGRSCQFTPL